MKKVIIFMKYPGNNKHCANYNPHDKICRYTYIMPGKNGCPEKMGSSERMLNFRAVFFGQDTF
jgi:hypothetical protein